MKLYDIPNNLKVMEFVAGLARFFLCFGRERRAHIQFPSEIEIYLFVCTNAKSFGRMGTREGNESEKGLAGKW